MSITSFVLNFLSTVFMTGVIWFVQIVHYPLFQQIESKRDFREYESEHVRLTSWVVIPPMSLEFITSLHLIVRPPAGVDEAYFWSGGFLLAIIWGSTVFWQIPCHNRLDVDPNSDLKEKLVRTNWIRTLAWTGRTILLVMVLRILL